MSERTGWQSRALRDVSNARKAHAALVKRLKKERIYDEWTPADVLAHQRQLKADFLAREADRAPK